MFFDDGPLKGESKGLRFIAKELGYNIQNNIKLDELKSILIQHSAFSGSKKLENLEKKMD